MLFRTINHYESESDEKIEEKPSKMTYKQGKDFAIRKCLTLIDDIHKDFLKTHKKKDDLCDCYLQAYHYLTKIKKAKCTEKYISMSKRMKFFGNTFYG